MARVRAEWGSVGEFVRRERLGWGDEEDGEKGEGKEGKGAFEDVGMFCPVFNLIYFLPLVFFFSFNSWGWRLGFVVCMCVSYFLYLLFF